MTAKKIISAHYAKEGNIEVKVQGQAKQYKLAAATKVDADALIGSLVANIRETFSGAVSQWTFEMDITCLRKSPSIAQLRVLAKTLDELRPVLVQYLQHTTIVCSTKLQRLLIATVFKIHRPSTPIQVIMQTPTPLAAAPHAQQICNTTTAGQHVIT